VYLLSDDYVSVDSENERIHLMVATLLLVRISVPLLYSVF